MKKIYYKFFYILLIIWFFIALFRIGVYFIQFITYDIHNFFITTDKKNYIYYGDTYVFFKEIEIISKEKKYYFVSKNGKAYFLGRYIFFPKELKWIKSSEELNKIDSKDQILVFYPKDFNQDELNKFFKSRYKVVKRVKNEDRHIGTMYELK